MSLSGQNDFIKDSLVVRSILKELGIKDFEEQVINYLLGLNYSNRSAIIIPIINVLIFILYYTRVLNNDFGRCPELFIIR